ncbi:MULTISPECIES: pyruvate dehydrogenase (acetyl-transferring), homodimeric type [Streptomyces]|uniref:pyruvate dehydrogenase (acetyl-transferring), homodimeric type n=1 Tax=Streptomyces TaxID=1883 RepID=UPI00177E546A|nr:MULTISPECIES: pyruvate dehydrogenase (acetyl-transferring), homodimeric type [Streptomyces]GHE37322.1 pyruvate dehydrogenase E1 component [Streptomyces griseoaurantiacus]MCF0086300.1 Pyruvate dehydrogenase E1 component [Streptomyces sp. MH192]MCF0100048.1 Pyruvate dehydrogenase E1 component [Streptomyces sp. MH191]MDX3091934.1 pyruvate dehydrogenase (acetyl-transferring), homodimeric type [Streptomyces sp. ME12-02E]MDX3334976.1 pyruvate dehydrogenase (acetyl-transferring), homodimeric type 
MASASDRNPIIIGGLPSQVPDFDPEETQEWLDSLDAAVDERGRERARYLMLRLIERARAKRVAVPEMRSTDYVNTIPTKSEPFFPGNEEIERKILNATRWNAAVMVSRAQRPGIGVGGHIATFASSASLYDVGFNHFFRGKDGGTSRSSGAESGGGRGGDQIFFQGHASPGIYARAFLLDRLSEAQLDGFRQEKSKYPDGLSSYPHPRSMPDFWEFPTVSMGLGPLGAIFQARMNRYMEARGIADTSDSHVWAFLGDGEMDEPESLGQLSIAARENLDNLTFVVNCNLQRLDGPVRGNGKIIQELESVFRGAGWNVIKLVWDRSWDPLLAQDRDGVLVNRMNTTPDGQFQTYATESGAYIREHFFGDDHRLRAMVENMTDDQILHLGRGGHDHRKIYAAFKAAKEHKGQPTVILAKTIKGWTLGPNFEGRNATHQMKKLTVDDLKRFRDRLHLPISDKELESGAPPYYHPGRNSEEIQYMHDRRRSCGGYVPTRIVRSKPLPLPEDKTYATVKKGSGQQSIATTMAFVRLLKDLMRDKEIGRRFVLIAPDEYRTFGMDSFFPSAKIYNPLGQQYESVDRELLLAYKESPTGQMLHDGISEAGCTASLIAAGSAYATHGEPLIPVYVFYSMFGFQRTGDQFWQMADQLARGFVLGATAGRTTLTGEGLQHADGHSQLLASANPACVAYDPAYGYEIAHIVQDGLRRMYGAGEEHPHGEDVFYYLTVYNEPIQHPAEPADVDVEGILKGVHRIAAGSAGEIPAQIMASGVAVPWALEAQRILAEEWNVRADVWSATSWNELRREAVAAEEHNLLHPEEEQRMPWVTRRLSGAEGPFVAVSDWMRSVPDQIARWVPGPYTSLGADGFGFADTRGAARRFFHIDAQSIVLAVLTELAKQGRVDRSALKQAIDRYRLLDASAADPGVAGGDA